MSPGAGGWGGQFGAGRRQRAGPARVAGVGFGQQGGTETTNVTVPGPGNAATETDQLPAAATQATIKVEDPTNTDLGASGFEKLVDVVVDANPKFGNVNRTAQRIITCAFIAALIGSSIDGDQSYSFTESDPVFEVFTLNVCLRIALTLSHLHAADVAAPASSGCSMAAHAIAVKITKTRAGYTGQVNGRSHKTTLRHAPAKVSCRRTRRGLLLSVRPSARGQTLRQAVGATLGMAYVNPTNHPLRVRTSFTVK